METSFNIGCAFGVAGVSTVVTAHSGFVLAAAFALVGLPVAMLLLGRRFTAGMSIRR
jgi:hypothetical protein